MPEIVPPFCAIYKEWRNGAEIDYKM